MECTAEREREVALLVGERYMTVALLVWRWLRYTSKWKKRIRLLDGRRAEDGCAAK